MRRKHGRQTGKLPKNHGRGSKGSEHLRRGDMVVLKRSSLYHVKGTPVLCMRSYSLLWGE